MDEYTRLRNILLDTETRRLDALEARLTETRRAVVSGLRTYQERLQSQAEQVDQIEHERLQAIADHLSALNEELEQLKNFSQPEAFTQALAQALPVAIQQANQKDATNTQSDLGQALQMPVTECLQKSVEQDTKMIADALFPVMGPAIRKSINEAFKTFLHSLNVLLEQGLSPRRQVLWRAQARLRGMSYAAFVLQKTLLYRVEQTFLIHRETGLLLQHISQPGTTLADSDAVSAMLTAIQDFIQDSFSVSKTEELASVEIGEYTVWLERGPHAVLACVIQGNAPRAFRQTMYSTLIDVHQQFPTELSAFDGDPEPFEPCHPLLENTLQIEQRSQEVTGERKRLLSTPLLITLGVLSIALIWYGVVYFLQQQRYQTYLANLSDEPGPVVTEHSAYSSRLNIEGLRDPLATPPNALLSQAGLESADVDATWRYYQAFDPVIVERRFQQALAPPSTVKMLFKQDKAILSGHAPTDWINEARSQLPLITGASGTNLEALQSTDSYLLQYANNSLAPSDNIELKVEGAVLSIIGEADSEEYEHLTTRLAELKEFDEVDVSQLIDLQAKLSAQFATLKTSLENHAIYFTSDTKLAESQLVALEEASHLIRALLEAGHALERDVQLEVQGETDGLGPEAFNLSLSEQRASFVQRWLNENADIDNTLLHIKMPEQVLHNQTAPDFEQRRVTFYVK
ncbi:MAG: hypothetical protein AAF512_08075 [Pseudomonadota bacterium]